MIITPGLLSFFVLVQDLSETELNRNSIRVYQLEVKQVRLDATTNSGYHQVTEEGLFQQGASIGNWI